MPLSALKFPFFTNYLFFRRNCANTYTNPNTIRFSYPCLKNALDTFFLKFPFFFALYSFSLPPKHFLIIFSGKLATKNGQKTSRKEEKNFFLSFYKLFHIFPLPLPKKTKPFTFSALFIIGNRKTARENVLLKKVFFFFLLSFTHTPFFQTHNV